jgi:uncharacterized repeat protein (TIGR03803 family)
MTKLSAWDKIGVLFLLSAATAIASSAQNFMKLLDFDGTNGGGPDGSLVQSTDGSLYGTTDGGGVLSWGTVFKISSRDQLTILHSFCAQTNCSDGKIPYAGLVQAINGNFYGTTTEGGANDAGSVFKITPGGTLTTLHSFDGSDGLNPSAGLVQARNGNLYGTTAGGGNNGHGTVFKITPGGTLTTLHSFDGTDGGSPFAALVEGTDGNLYGITSGINTNGHGTVFKISLGGDLTTLYSFCVQGSCTDGDGPVGLVQALNGNFYGTTIYRGGLTCNPPYGCGTVFDVTRQGELTTLHNFDDSDGANPMSGLAQATNKMLYGTTNIGGTNGNGTVFEITPQGELTTLHNFDGADGYSPQAGLMQATDGNIYGTTFAGGAHGQGTIFTLSLGLAPFVSFLHNPAKVAQSFGILGSGLKGTTGILLHGTPANFTVESDTLLIAIVPAGATTGYVTVTTPSGTLASNTPFHVIP